MASLATFREQMLLVTSFALHLSQSSGWQNRKTFRSPLSRKMLWFTSRMKAFVASRRGKRTQAVLFDVQTWIEGFETLRISKKEKPL